MRKTNFFVAPFPQKSEKKIQMMENIQETNLKKAKKRWWRARKKKKEKEREGSGAAPTSGHRGHRIKEETGGAAHDASDGTAKVEAHEAARHGAPIV